MGAGTSPADRAAAADGPAAGRAEAVTGDGAEADTEAAADVETGVEADVETEADAVVAQGGAPAATVGETADGTADGRTGSHLAPAPATASGTGRSREASPLTLDTARPEGGGRAAGGDAPAPARQWPLLAVLCTAAIGLLIVATDPFVEAFRIGTILIGVALIGGAVLRLVIPSVGMLAVRSRFTDLVTYGLLGVLIVMLSLMAQPKPWLDIPFLENAVHFTIR